MKVDTIELDGDTLSASKRVEVASKQFETPVKALQVGKLRASEKVSPLARGIVEIYGKASAAALTNSRSGWTGLAKKLERQEKNAHNDEFVVPFIEYDDSSNLEAENAAEIAKLQTNYGDILTVPLMSELVDAAEDGDGRTTPHVTAIIENTKQFLKAVDKLGVDKPVMGVIPPISHDCTQALVDVYLDHGLRAYCVDFNRRSPMAQSQIDHVINPLMQSLSSYNTREESLLYGVNANDSRPVTGKRRTSDAVYAYTLGFDIVGDNHIAPKLPEEVFEELAKKAAKGEVELKLFDIDTVSIVEVPVSELGSFLPDDAEIPVDRIQDRIKQDPDEQYRFTKLINAELISLYLESEGGIDPQKIFVDLRTGAYTQNSDLERVRELSTEVLSGS
ncbi:hypothetical protein C481_20966 [Natrialba asiatica DSM 12278]|uniref:Uncharacterized protein n=2 Tax=Natrialba asiatica TaxID=64602 RepID=M0AGT6_NATA1|nr:hypothetical protein C481_20966 [Natrialba asiatica DSM 12278]